ncbi:MAG: response regulator [Gammaproteobacteria bacterium]|nr:response regulator [Gammaproteobacteria bacterium]MBU1601634.1 response regulator [Gammaproteobacteria bacterium]MBU2434712.1 response regulator [Gammaproteobacteria bacterium]MBU2447953.1 response regulator [Gammaproteobacteria bacterium]
MRVLIVDDNASMRDLLTALLSSQGYEVVGALEDGNGVIDAIRTLAPEIVCLDYLLPGRDGLDILSEINSLFPQIDVLFISASEAPGLETKAADAGAAGFLRKPFGQKQVIDELQQVRETRRRASPENQPEAAVNSPAPQPVAEKASKTPGRQPTAVIADDNSSIRLLLKGLLTELGLQVVGQAANGEEAIRAATNYQPTVLFLDVNMPILGGLEALPRIVAASPKTSVVMVTGDTSRTIVQQAAGLGARGYVVKPIRPAYVEKFLKQLFNA